MYSSDVPSISTPSSWYAVRNWNPTLANTIIPIPENKGKTISRKAISYHILSVKWNIRKQSEVTIKICKKRNFSKFPPPFFFVFCFFWLHHVACGILIPQSGIEHGTMAVRAHNPNYWTARELPKFIFKENQDQLETGECLFFPWESAEFTDFYFW